MIISNSFRDRILSKIAFLQKQKINSTSNYWNISYEQGIFLSNLVDFKKPKSVLEIGTSNGFSGLWLNLNLDESSKYTTVEVDKTRYELAKVNFEQVGLKNFICVNSDALKFLEGISEKFDFVFVDAGHCLYQNILDLLVGRKLLAESGVVIFDNVTSHSQLEDFVKNILKKYDSELIKIGGGMLVVYF